MRTLRASHNHAAVWSDVYTSNSLIVAFQFVLKREFGPSPVVEFDIVIASDRKSLPVSREGMVGDGMVEEVVDLWARHLEDLCDRSSSLLSPEGKVRKSWNRAVVVLVHVGTEYALTSGVTRLRRSF